MRLRAYSSQHSDQTPFPGWGRQLQWVGEGWGPLSPVEQLTKGSSLMTSRFDAEVLLDFSCY